ncbi:hypothetical protein CYLTODRAFT_490387 [Cylindrobasidium torrendii FP15055 ss-10]|uniref:Uncharacterized protein n=1 Tax=Cylindrobasidium torrendii FP15055 ss-10 TaxID=1314674 RepID=A0A0D7BDV5_9AGAR|nr:hypothetical protein CYLTODRAFT_490387 [Cylindrobasidium torrendii FP15055 ss-10]
MMVTLSNRLGLEVAHINDEYSSGRWERKAFTVASANTYHNIITKLEAYEFDYPNLVKEWRSKHFQAACEKAQKGWLIRADVPEDAPEVKDALRLAEEAATARRAGVAKV